MNQLSDEYEFVNKIQYKRNLFSLLLNRVDKMKYNVQGRSILLGFIW